MNVVYLIILYVFIVGYLAREYTLNNYGSKSRYTSKVVLAGAILVVLVPVVIIGLRQDYGDTAMYLHGFTNIPGSLSEVIENIEDSRGAGWLFYEWFIKQFTNDANAFLFITAVIEMGAFVKLYYKISTDYSYSFLLFFMSCYFLNLMNGIRQMLAVALVIYFIDWAIDKKYIRFILIVLLASTIHVSAIIWIPIIFVVQGRAMGWRTVVAGIALIIVLMYLNRFTDLLEDTLTGTLYEGYTEQFANDDGANIMHSVIAAIPVGIALLRIDYLKKLKDHRIAFLINVSVINLMINIIAHFTSGILIGRMPMYLNALNYALLPILFDKLFDWQSRKYMRYMCMAGYLMYAIYYVRSMGVHYISTILHIS